MNTSSAMAEVVVQYVLSLEIKMEKGKKQHGKRNLNDVKNNKTYLLELLEVLHAYCMLLSLFFWHFFLNVFLYYILFLSFFE